ncbi:MAG TPA: TlpA disulfide reductase family protein [Streptosporangiaceae bacterium]|nr:TlpA disulfide reductase family protein [Streptosporangiaceae bacterium]
MTSLAAAVAFIGALGLFNLLMMCLVVRRLRGYAEQLSRQPRFGGPPRLPVGTEIPDFTAITPSGTAMSLGELTGACSAVAFLSVNCPPCRDQLPEFTGFARTVAGGAAQVLAVVIARDVEAAAEFTAELHGVATVVVEQARRGTVQAAFSVQGYPSFFLLDERGRVEASGPTVRSLTAAQPV